MFTHGLAIFFLPRFSVLITSVAEEQVSGARSHRSYYNFTEATITTPRLSRISDRLIEEVSAYVAMAFNLSVP